MACNRLFIITGDYSGDIHAAKVVRALRAQQPSVEIAAVGGSHLQAEGVQLLEDQAKMGRVGFGSFLGAPYHYFLGKRILRFLKTFRPDAVLLIDYGVFNLWMAKQLKAMGLKVFYFIPPQVWAYRRGRIRKIKAGVDHVFCIFPFEEALYQSHGIPVTYVGHPLVGELPPAPNRAAFCQQYGLDPEKPIVGLFPGSRKLEVDYLIGAMVGSVPLIHRKHPHAQFVMSQAGSLNPVYFQARFEQAVRQQPKHLPMPQIHVLPQASHAILGASDLAILASGTVTLEAALYQTPHVLVYKLHPIVYRIATWLFPFPCLGLPNILTDMHNPVITELWQDRATPCRITQAALPLFDPQSPEHQKAIQGFETIRGILKGEAPRHVAEGILALLSEPAPAKTLQAESPLY